MAKRVIKATADNGTRKFEIVVKITLSPGDYFMNSIKANTERMRNEIYDMLRLQQFHNSEIKIK